MKLTDGCRAPCGRCGTGPPTNSAPCLVPRSNCRRSSTGGEGAGSFSPSRVFWLFLAQILSADHSCRTILRRFLAGLAREGKSASARTAAYCKARQRLRPNDLEAVHAFLVRTIRARYASARLWRGRRVKVVDGSGLSMPDTPQNQALYPQSAHSTPGCSFPVMRVVAVFCLGTGVLVDIAKGALNVSERALFRRLWGLFEAGDVILADRGFGGFAEFYYLLRRGVDCVMRNHHRRTVGLTIVRRLGKGDHLVQWHKSRPPVVWLDKAAWATLPDTLLVRQIQFAVRIQSFRTRHVTLATTLLDPVAFPAEAFLELYGRRWRAELYLRDIKITLGMDVLRCKTPEMVHKELSMFLIAYNLVRLLMLEAATSEHVPLERLSFKGTVATLRAWAPLLTASPHPKERQRLLSLLLRCLAGDPLPLRPNRLEPRAKKRRPKNYQLLNKPRHLFKEIRHRNKYTKVLS